MTVARALTSTKSSISNAASVTATLGTGSLATGDLLVAYGEIQGSVQVLTPTDDVGDSNQNNWTLIETAYYATAVGVRMYVWYRVVGSSPGAGKTLTVTRDGGSVFIGCGIHSYRNDVTAGLAWSLATSATSNGSGSTTQTTGTLTFSGTNNVVFNAIASDRVETASGSMVRQTSGYINGGATGDYFNQTSTQAPGWTSGANANWGSISGVFQGTVSVDPAITGGTANPVHQSTGNTITGVRFGASQGAGTLVIGGQAQTVTAWSDTSITYTANRGANLNDVAVNAVVTDNGGLFSSNYALTGFQEPSGYYYVTLTSVNSTADYRITAIADLAIGNQLEWDNALVTINADGTYVADPSVTQFYVRVGVTGDGWGALALQTINAASPGGANSATGGRFIRPFNKRVGLGF